MGARKVDPTETGRRAAPLLPCTAARGGIVVEARAVRENRDRWPVSGDEIDRAIGLLIFWSQVEACGARSFRSPRAAALLCSSE